MQSVANGEMKRSSRSSKKLNNLEAEVNIILSQDESDEENKIGVNEISPKSPKTRRTKVLATPKSSGAVLQEYLQTPRRSCRKSVKPTQDYDDIVNKSTRSAKKEIITEQDKENQGLEEVPPRWTPAKVGRVSNKRTRKSRRTGNPKKQDDGETSKVVDKNECNEENKDAVDVNKDQKKTVNFAEIIMEKNEHDEIINQTLKTNVINENVQEKGILKANSDSVAKVIKQKQVDEIVDNMEHLNVKTECNNMKTEREEYKQVQNVEKVANDDFKDDNDSIHLIQDDSEDSQDFKEKTEKETCIMDENNIINGEIKDFRKNVQDTFGCYLKSKDINISDLGLNPIKDEQDEEITDVIKDKLKFPLSETEEMPSLKISEDEDQVNATQCITLNETLDASDSVIVIGDIDQNCTKSNEEIMETLQVSDDDGETPRKYPRVVITDTELKDQVIISSPKGSADIKAKLPSTPKTSPKSSSTKKKSTKHRFPTPYRNKQGNIVKKTPVKIPFNSSMIPITTMEPKEIVLRGIRKRSLSVCIEGTERKSRKLMTESLAKAKHDRVVSFYSPANQTTIIDDLDVKISKKLKEENPKEKKSSKNFVTTRRKRSMSLDESMSTLVSKLPRPVVGQKVANKIQTSTSKPQLRTKLPNFAAIHQKQFEKMENLEEHVNRKQERSNNLINSVTKSIPVSAQKSFSILKNSNNKSSEKPKALKKIDLGNFSQINKSKVNATVTGGDLCRSQKMHDDNKVTNLPDRRLVAANLPTPNRPTQQQKTYKYLKASQNTDIENPRLNTKAPGPSNATFNLSTSLMVKPTKSSSSFVKNANTSQMSYNDKTALRLQRHMDLFKGRGPSNRSATSSNKNEILRGVRSNRRFELQMQHRKNLEN